MEDSQKPMAMARRGAEQIVILPRDPETAYVYWEVPGLKASGQHATLTIYAQTKMERQVVDSFEITEECGGRFITYSRPDALQIGAIEWGEKRRESTPVRAPRRESGDDKPGFVRIQLGDQGLTRQPAEHKHAVHGRLPPASDDNPSSHRDDNPSSHSQAEKSHSRSL